MAFLDSFKLVDESKNNPFITLRNTTITFSKSAVELLNYSDYIHMYIDPENHRIAFQSCKQDKSAIKFYEPPKEGRQMLVRVAGKSKVQMIMDMAGIEDCGKGVRLYGSFIEDEGVLYFNL